MMPGICDTPLVGTDVGGYSGGTLDTQTVFVGISGSAANGDRERGFVLSQMGSISDGTSNLYGGAQIKSLYASEDTETASFDVTFAVAGSVSNSGWNTMTVGGSLVLRRADAFFSSGGGSSIWTWASVGNPFGVSGAKTVGFD